MPVDATDLDLELTESMPMVTVERAVDVLREFQAPALVRQSMTSALAARACRTGSSSLSCLMRLPIDVLKVDQPFARDITTDSASGAIVALACQLTNSCLVLKANQ